MISIHHARETIPTIVKTADPLLIVLYGSVARHGQGQDVDIVFMDGIYRGRYPAEEGLLPQGDPSAEDAAKAIRIADKIVNAVAKQRTHHPKR